MNRSLISSCKALVEKGDLPGLQAFYTSMTETDYGYNPNWQYIYHQVYLHACLKKQKEIASWLTELYESFDAVTKIALRQIFPYGRYLLAK